MGVPALRLFAACRLPMRRWLGIAAVAAVATVDCRAGILDVFPRSGVSVGGDWTFSLNTAEDLSGSAWSTGSSESDVYLAALKHVQRQSGDVNPRRSWEIRLGKGGQIYSIRSDFGEAVPPQYRPPGARQAPWVDEVWQTVGVNRSLNDRTSDASKYYIHQAGTYLGDGLAGPFYSPLLAAGATADDGYSTVNWGQQAHVPSNHRSHLLYYQKTRDVGGGIIEITNVTYNFGNQVIDWINSPWGGTRSSTLGTHVIANPGDPTTYTDRSGATFSTSAPEPLSSTGGWMAFSKGTAAGHDALAIVTGHDKHLGQPFQWDASVWRHGVAGNIPGERDYLVGTLIRKVAVQPGETFFSRYYMVVGSLGNVVNMIANNDLVAKADYGLLEFAEADSSRTGWAIHDSGGAISLRKAVAGKEDFFTYDQPVAGSKPLLLIEDARGNEFVTIDPYTLSGKPYDGQTAYRSLLGFVLPADKTNQAGDGIGYTDLASLFPAGSTFFRDGSSGMAVVTPEPVEPVKITGVYVKGSGWNADYLARSPFANEQGATVGWELPDGPAQLADASNVAWTNVDTITIEFDQPIAQPDAAALQLVRGTTSGNQTIVPTLAPTLLGDGSVAQWTLPAGFAALERGKYVISITAEGITNTAGTTILDGDWITGESTFAEGSGDGEAGGAFHFLFNALVGDINGDGVMNAGDSSAIRNALTTPLNTPLAADSSNYRLDIDGLNSLNSADLSKTRNQLSSALGTQLASLPPVTAPTAGGYASRAIAPVPEPAGCMIGMAAVAAGLVLRRQRSRGESRGRSRGVSP